MLRYGKEIEVSHPHFASGSNIALSVELADFWGKNDCKVGHFGYNFYIRTPKGLKALSYKSDKTMERAIERVLKNNGFTIHRWIAEPY